MIRRLGAALLAGGALAGCAAGPETGDRPAAVSLPQAAPSPPPSPAPALTSFDTSGLTAAGRMEQGGWIRGVVPRGTAMLMLGTTPVAVAADGSFFAGFDRDAPAALDLVAMTSDGRRAVRSIAIARRDWRIERVNVALRGSVPSAVYMARRQPELDAIAAARAVRSDSRGWTQDFIRPAAGRYSGLFGSQRIYRGEPAAYHSGLDIAPGAGAPYVAPADGVVVLAATTPFTLEGYLLIVDHGMGLNSAFLHASRLAVKQGDRVSQGQLLGYVGATGRATGPHLHWSLVWQGSRLDPLLFLPRD